MNDKQLEIYNHNIRVMTKTFAICGGTVAGLLDNHLAFIECMSRNGVKFNPTVEDVD